MFVPEKSKKSVQSDILIAMRRFKNVVTWKAFWRDQKKSTETKLCELKEEESSMFMATGLNTGLKPTFGIKTTKHVSENLEGFLTAVKKPAQGGFHAPTLWTPEQENK